MTNNWDYGGAYMRYPAQNGIVEVGELGQVMCHDIFKPLPAFMQQADILFTDPPWNKGNIRSFYSKAGLDFGSSSYDAFVKRLFECFGEINPSTCYVEVGKEYLADFIMQMRSLYPHVTFYNSSYYHKKQNTCYVVCGSRKRQKRPLDYMDEEDIIEWICQNEDYTCIGDLCIGRGLVGVGAYKCGKRFVGTELNHKRLSVLLERVALLEKKAEGTQK